MIYTDKVQVKGREREASVSPCVPTVMTKVTNKKAGREILLSGTGRIAAPRAGTPPSSSSAVTWRRRRWTIATSSHLSSLLCTNKKTITSMRAYTKLLSHITCPYSRYH